MKLCGNPVDPNAGARMDVAITDFLHSHLLPFSLAQDPKLIKIIDEARKLGPLYIHLQIGMKLQGSTWMRYMSHTGRSK